MGSQHSPERSERLSVSDPANPWVSGWYVFEDGNVVGPLEAHEVFSRPEKTDSGHARMISRKGFTQWYPLQDFAAIHAMAGRYSDYLTQSKSDTSQFAASKGAPQVIAKQIPTQLDHKQVAANLSAKDSLIQDFETIGLAQREILAARTNDYFEVTKDAQAAESESQPRAKKLKANDRKRDLNDDRSGKKSSGRQAKQSATIATNKSVPGPTISLDQQYLKVASRLRLGRPESVAMQALVYFPLSLGVYWWAWLTKVSEEVSWHLNGASRMNLILPLWMSMIPGVHMILAFFVARMVSQMERQNGYRSINPWIAACVALCPPFYIVMIQSALNKHWRLHVQHSLTQI
jgi:hypothetical protein